MIEIEIPKDIKDYEPKLIGPLTTRQTICSGAILVIMLVGYNVLKMFFENGLKVVIPLIICLIPIAIGWYKPYGMRFEKYAISQLYTVILPPKKRLYKVENLYEQFDKEIEKEEKAIFEQNHTNTKTKKQLNKKEKKGDS